MSRESRLVKELFSSANRQKLINGFLIGGNTIRFQANDGTMVVLELIPLDQNKDKAER